MKLNENDYSYLKKIIKQVKEVNRAKILLLLDKNEKIDDIAYILDISVSNVAKIKKRYLGGGLEFTLNDKPKLGQPKSMELIEKTEIIALTCVDPSEGRKRWTIRLSTETLREKRGFESLNRGTVRIVLKKAQLNLG